MAIEQGIVIRMGQSDGSTAWVKTARSSACESCSAKENCNPGAAGNSQEVEAINTAGAMVGDRIQLSISSSSLLKAMFLLYLFPILCMLAGGIAGNQLAPRFQINPSVLAAIMAMANFVMALVIVRVVGQRLGREEAYRPKITRVLGHEGPHFLQNCLSQSNNNK
jgi:sigma-E factor negative regulatory protein RseC